MTVPVVVDLPDRTYRAYEAIAEANGTPLRHLVASGAIKALNRSGPSRRAVELRGKILHLHEQGLTAQQIADRVRLSKAGVQHHLHAAGVSFPPPKRIDVDKFRELWEQGLSYERIATELDCSTGSVGRLRRRLNLPTRSENS